MNQPQTIVFQRRKYKLATPHKDLGNGISEGPFYSRRGVNPKDWQFLPDAAFLLGQTTTPAFMHCIQQRADVSTPHPATRVLLMGFRPYVKGRQ